MARFVSLTKGIKAVKRIDLPYGGENIPVALRVLSVGELASVLSAARASAKAQGVDDPKDGSPLYDMALQIETLVVAVRDADDVSRPFFDGEGQIRNDLDDDQVQYLFEHYLLWKDEQSPQALKYTPEEIYTACTELGVSESAVPFLAMRPGLRLTCMRFLAKAWLTSLGINLDFSSPSAVATTSTTPTPEASGEPQ